MRTLLYSFVYVLFTGLLPLTAAAQFFKPDSVYLKSGEAVFGRIIETDSLKGITVMNDCGLHIIPYMQLERIGFGKTKPVRPVKKTGYYNMSTVGLLFGEGSNGISPIPSFTMVNGMHFNRKFYAGLGFGFEHFDWSVLPVFASAHYIFYPDRFGPYAAFKIGYTFPLEKYDSGDWGDNNLKYHGGVMLSPEVGINIPMGQHSSFVIGFGYHFQELSEDCYQWWSSFSPVPINRVYTNFNRISVRMGFVFR
jgi:hypothetical protein